VTRVEEICEAFYRDGIAVCDDFVSTAEVEIFREQIRSGMATLKKAGIGSKQDYQVDAGVRGDFIRWIDPAQDTLYREHYFGRLQPVIEAFNRRFFLGISGHEHHLAYYPPGTGYAKHVDTFRNTDARVVSSVLYLNAGWKAGDGGELCIYPQGRPAVSIAPLAGRLALFESTLEHEVLESRAPRYSITGWFKRNTLR
jgi:SM-20-related protein